MHVSNQYPSKPSYGNLDLALDEQITELAVLSCNFLSCLDDQYSTLTDQGTLFKLWLPFPIGVYHILDKNIHQIVFVV